VGGDEDRVVGEGPPRGADGADAADLLGREQQQDLEQQLHRQDAIHGRDFGGPDPRFHGGRPR
jgi:hypothetical protein